MIQAQTGAHNPAIVAMLAQLSDDDRRDAAAILAEQGLPLTDPETAPDDDDGPLSDPDVQAVFETEMRRAHRAWNANEAAHIAAALNESPAFGMQASMILYRLKGLGVVTRSNADIGREICISARNVAPILDGLAKLGFVRRKPGRCNVGIYRLDREALDAFNYAALVQTNPELARVSARYVENRQTVKQGEQPDESFHGLSNSAQWFVEKRQTRIQGKESVKPPRAPVDDAAQQNGTRTPGEDDEENSQPAAPATAPVAEHRAAADMLQSYCDVNRIRHDVKRIATYCHLANVTTAEARALLKAAKDYGVVIDHFNWFKQKLDTLRAPDNARRGQTPIGGVPMHNDVLDAMTAFDATYTGPTPAGGAGAVLAELKRKFPYRK